MYFGVFSGGVDFAWAATSDAARVLAISPSANDQNARQDLTIAEAKPEILTSARVVVDSQRTLQNESAGVVVLTLQASNIQVQAEWRVTNAANNFAITNGTLSLVNVNKFGTLVATIYLADKFSQLNTAYTDLTVSAIIIAVSVGAQSADDYKAVLKAHFDSFMPTHGTYIETATGFNVFRTLFGTSIETKVGVSNSGYTIGDYATNYPSEVFAQINFDINGLSDVTEFLQQAISDHDEDFQISSSSTARGFFLFFVRNGLDQILVKADLSDLRVDKQGASEMEFSTFQEALDYLSS